jgi:hypothetical protein
LHFQQQYVEKLALSKAAKISKKPIHTKMKTQFNSVTEKYAEVGYPDGENFSILFSADILIKVNNVFSAMTSLVPFVRCSFKTLKGLCQLTKDLFYDH